MSEPTGPLPGEVGHRPSGALHETGEPLDDELPTLDPTTAPAGPGALTMVVTTLTTMATPPVNGAEPITCPRCHTEWVGGAVGQDADSFCPKCQFPMFWRAAAPSTGSSDLREALSRMPGTVGRSTLSSIACPTCSEANLSPPLNCWRCHNPLFPVPPPPQVPEPQIELHYVPIVYNRRLWPWVVATGVLAQVAVILAIILFFVD